MPLPFLPSANRADPANEIGTFNDFARAVVTPNNATTGNQSVFLEIGASAGTNTMTFSMTAAPVASSAIAGLLSIVDATGSNIFIPFWR